MYDKWWFGRGDASLRGRFPSLREFPPIESWGRRRRNAPHSRSRSPFDRSPPNRSIHTSSSKYHYPTFLTPVFDIDTGD